MNDLSALLPDVAGAQLVAFTLVLARVGGIFAIGPIFASRSIPLRVRSLAALALALALTPIATDARAVPTDAVAIAADAVQEAAIGLAFALAVGTVVATVTTAASLIDTLAGFGFGQLVDPVSQVSGGVFGQIYSLFATLTFLLTGGDRLIVAGLAKTYSIVPLGAQLDTQAAATLAVDSLARLLVVAVQIAAPVLVAVFLTDAAFGIVARVVPQMNVLVVGLPAKILVTFAVVAAALPVVALRVDSELSDAVVQTLRALR